MGKKQVLKPCRLVVALLYWLILSASLHAAELNHPGLLHTYEEIEFVAQQVKAGEQPWKDAYESLKNKNYSKLSYKPKPLKKLPGIDSHADKDRMTEDGSAAYSHTLQWLITGKQAHADKAIEILNAWSVFETSGNWLYLSWAVPKFLNAAELLRYSDSGWKSADIEKFEAMVRDHFLRPMKNNSWVNNAMHSSIEGYVATAIFLDDKKEFNAAMAKWRKWSVSYIYIKSDGDSPKALWPKKRTSWGYFTPQNGQAMETCRDLNHVKLGARSIFFGAEMGWKQGVDLWSEEKDRFSAFLESHASWMMDGPPKSVCGGQIKCAGPASKGYAPCNEEAFDVALSQLSGRLGLSLPKSTKMANRNRPTEPGRGHRNYKFETLTHGGIKAGSTPKPPVTEPSSGEDGDATNKAPNGYSFAGKEGAIIKIDSASGVAFGANGKFNFKYGVSSVITCDTKTFGDPIFGVKKACYTKAAANNPVDEPNEEPQDVLLNDLVCSVVDKDLEVSRELFSQQCSEFKRNDCDKFIAANEELWLCSSGDIDENFKFAMPSDDGSILIEAEDYARAVDTTAGNNGEEYRNDDVDIEKTADTDGGYNIGWIAAGESLSYDLYNAKTEEKRLSLRLASVVDTGLVSIELNGKALLSNQAINYTAGEQKFATQEFDLGELLQGNHQLAIVVVSGQFNLNWLRITSAGGSKTGGESPDTADEPDTKEVPADATDKPEEEDKTGNGSVGDEDESEGGAPSDSDGEADGENDASSDDGSATLDAAEPENISTKMKASGALNLHLSLLALMGLGYFRKRS